MAQSQQADASTDADKYELIDHNRDNDRPFDTWEEAQEKMNEMVAMGAKPEDFEINPIKVPEGTDKDSKPELDEFDEEDDSSEQPAPPESADNQDVAVVEDSEPEEQTQPIEALPDEAGVDTDPLDILPDYMIDHVQGTPTLNKRGLSVLAYHYGVTVTDREIVVNPHESDWQYAIVETTVENEDGNTFVGTGTAHLDRGDDKGTLLEMAETRSYKRAVSFATGTGIVSYQELTGHLEDSNA